MALSLADYQKINNNFIKSVNEHERALTRLNVLGANYLKCQTKSKRPLEGTYARSVLLKKLHSYLLLEPVPASWGSISI